jgi:hypothetical protein
MKRFLLLVATLGASLLFAFAQPEGMSQRLQEHVEFLTSPTLEGRKAGSTGARLAAEYIGNEFGSLGLKPFERADYFHPFTTAFQDGVFRNVVARIDGINRDKYIVIGAHYDHLGIEDEELHPGANDNASGTAALIELARLFSAMNYKPTHTLIFAAFDAEEIGLHGSQDLADRLRTEDVKVMINMDMVGRLGNEGLIVEGVGTLNGSEDIIARVAKNNGLEIKTKRFETSLLTATDTESFAKRSIPTLALTTGPHKDMHKISDTPEKIDIGGLEQVVGFAADLLRELDHNGQIVPTGRVARKHRSDILSIGLSAGVGSSALLHPTAATPVGLATNIGLSVQYISSYWALRTSLHYDRRESYTLANNIPQPHTREGVLIPLEILVKTEGAINIFASAGGWVALPRAEWGASWGLGCRIGSLSIEGVSRHGLTPTLPTNARTRTTLCILGVYF